MKKTSSPFIRSKKHRFQQPVAAAFSSLLLLSGSALAADETSDVVQLGTLKIEAKESASTYRAEKVSSDKFTQKLLDTPQTIQVIT